MNRMIERDHRAVVIRCTATNTTPADESDAKNSQLTWYARQARSGATKSPIAKISAPMTASAVQIVPATAGTGFEYAATTSSRVGVRADRKSTRLNSSHT